MALWQPEALAETQFVGSQACAGCHPGEYARWQDSQHAHAMRHASEESVLGDFADASFEYNGIRSRFYRRDGRFFVLTDGADGELAEFRIGYTFGIEPLQQYLVEFADGRLQALSIAWDSRPADQGGQRWFHLYPEQQVRHADPLHWTRPAQNWNFMCADCHSTNLRKDYDTARERFTTRWSEISVGCEACHGPGSDHLRWAASDRQDARKGLTILLDERRGSGWRTRLEDIAARRKASGLARKEHDVCAQCHSRRQQIAEGYYAGKPLLDHYRPALLEPDLYHPDGQQREEVFVSASFAQSRMYHAGVTCSDCHEPHGQRLRLEGNALCGQCHLPARFDSPAHHFHAEHSTGARCVNCHMPEATYMVVDPRRDHSLRIPRPDLSAALGTPDACSQCHTAQGPEWAAAQIRRHHPNPRPGFQDFATTFATAELGLPSALEDLARRIGDLNQPSVVRASAAARLGLRAENRHGSDLAPGLRDPDPVVRLASATALAGAPPEKRSEWLTPLLGDASRVVRIEAARLLADLQLSAEYTQSHAYALAEYEASLRLVGKNFRAAARHAMENGPTFVWQVAPHVIADLLSRDFISHTNTARRCSSRSSQRIRVISSWRRVENRAKASTLGMLIELSRRCCTSKKCSSRRSSSAFVG